MDWNTYWAAVEEPTWAILTEHESESVPANDSNEGERWLD